MKHSSRCVQGATLADQSWSCASDCEIAALEAPRGSKWPTTVLEAFGHTQDCTVWVHGETGGSFHRDRPCSCGGDKRDPQQVVLRIEPKGATGWIVGLTVTGGYVECFVRNGERLIECNFYDGDNRDLAWTEQAVEALLVARHWQRTGEMKV